MTVIRQAEATGLLRIETETRVTRIEVDGEAESRASTYVREGREFFQPARSSCSGHSSTRTPGCSCSRRRGPSRTASRTTPPRSASTLRCTPTRASSDSFPAGSSTSGAAPGPRRRTSTTGTATTSTTPVSDSSAGAFWRRTRRSRSHWRPGRCRLRAALRIRLEGVASCKRTVDRQVSASWTASPTNSNVLDLDPVAVRPLRGSGRPCDVQARRERPAWGAFLRDNLPEPWLLGGGAGETWYRPREFVDPRHAYGGTRMGGDPETLRRRRLRFRARIAEPRGDRCLGVSDGGWSQPDLTLQAITWRTAGVSSTSGGQRRRRRP